MDEKILEVKQSRVLEAAKKCESASRILRALFPEAFAESTYQTGTIFVKESDDSIKLLLAAVGSGTARLINMADGQPYYGILYRITAGTNVLIPDSRLKGFKIHWAPEKTVNRRSLKTPDPSFEDEEEDD